MQRRVLTALVVVLALAGTTSIVWADKPIQFDDKGNEVGWESSGANAGDKNTAPSHSKRLEEKSCRKP